MMFWENQRRLFSDGITGAGDQLLQGIDAVGRRGMGGEEVGQMISGFLLLNPFEEVGGPGHVTISLLKKMEAELVYLSFLLLGELGLDPGQTVLEKLRDPALVPQYGGRENQKYQYPSQPSEMVALGKVAEFMSENHGQFVFRVDPIEQTSIEHDMATGQRHGINSRILLDMELVIERLWREVLHQPVQDLLEILGVGRFLDGIIPQKQLTQGSLHTDWYVWNHHQFQGKSQQHVRKDQRPENGSREDGKLFERMGIGNVDVFAQQLGSVLQDTRFSLTAVPYAKTSILPMLLRSVELKTLAVSTRILTMI